MKKNHIGTREITLMVKLISAKFHASIMTNNILNHLYMKEIITMYKDIKEALRKYSKKIVPQKPWYEIK